MKLLAIVFGALLLSSRLFAQDVNVQYDEAADFKGYKTFTWKGCVIGEPGAALPSITKLNIQRVRYAMSQQLMSKGLTEVEQDGDLYATCTGGRQDNRKVGWTSTRTIEWTNGLLILDLVDAKREELAWRAFCSATISDPWKIDKKIQSAVKKAFKSYPPRVRP